MELSWIANLADRRIFPAIDPVASAPGRICCWSRRRGASACVRRILANTNSTERAMDMLIKSLKQTETDRSSSCAAKKASGTPKPTARWSSRRAHRHPADTVRAGRVL